MTRDELKQRVDTIYRVFNDIVDDNTTFTALDPNRLRQLETGINKSYGQAMAFLHEYLTTQKSQQKQRVVITQVNGDVTVGGDNDLFAKTIECKNITSPDRGSVKTAIVKAVEQLGGQTGHQPRDGDVRVVDVRICQESNPWPLPGGQYGVPRDLPKIGAIQDAAIGEISDIMNAGLPGATAVRNWLETQQYDNLQQYGRLNMLTNDFGSSFHPKSTRPIYQGTGGIQRIRCLTVKVRWDPFYLLATEPHIAQRLALLVIQVYRNPFMGNLRVEIGRQEIATVQLNDLFPGFEDLLYVPMEI